MQPSAIEIRQTEVFARWFDGLKDREARARIAVRLRRLSLGNPGDVRPVGRGISELRIDYGPGYRVYYTHATKSRAVLLVGGDKRTQARDIDLARSLARKL